MAQSGHSHDMGSGPSGRSGSAALACLTRERGRLRQGGQAMGLQLGDTAPDCVAQTTEETIRFHEWIGDSWAVLFSHPKDFTPICTTELGSVAKLSPEFERRNVKLIGLSVDSVEDHDLWLDDIEETQGARPGYPIIADTGLGVAKLYGMLEADAEGGAA